MSFLLRIESLSDYRAVTIVFLLLKLQWGLLSLLQRIEILSDYRADTTELYQLSKVSVLINVCIQVKLRNSEFIFCI